MRIRVLATATLSLCLASCNVAFSPPGKTDDQSSSAETSSNAPLTAAGAPTPLAAERGEDGVQWAASVTRLDPVPGESAKLFGTAGGDPAMNGLYTYIAFFPSAAEGWQVYKIGDFLDYTVLSHAKERVDLEIDESTMDQATGTIGSHKRRIIVQWTQGANDPAPTSVTVTPAD